MSGVRNLRHVGSDCSRNICLRTDLVYVLLALAADGGCAAAHTARPGILTTIYLCLQALARKWYACFVLCMFSVICMCVGVCVRACAAPAL
jgi:hypothetical protein